MMYPFLIQAHKTKLDKEKWNMVMNSGILSLPESSKRQVQTVTFAWNDGNVEIKFLIV